MAQELTITLSKDETLKVIKDALVQDDIKNPTEYEIRYEIDEDNYECGSNDISFTIVKVVTIAGLSGELKESFDYYILNKILEMTFELGEYEIGNWDFIITNKGKTFEGLEILLNPLNEDRTFVREIG